MIYEKDHAIAQVTAQTKLVKDIHFHNEFEIICCTEGSFNAVIDSVEYSVNKGQSVISFPNQSHYYICDNNINFKSYMLIFSANIFDGYANDIITKIPQNPIINHDKDFPMMTKMLEQMRKDNKYPTEYSLLRRVGYCKVLCAELFEKLNLVPANKSNPDVLSSIVEYCNTNFKNDIHLDDLQNELHVNKYYISHLFKEKFKMGFNEYIHNLRIREACKILNKSDETVTSIATTVGYNTVRNFNRVFQKSMGVTPCEYRNNKKSKTAKS